MTNKQSATTYTQDIKLLFDDYSIRNILEEDLKLLLEWRNSYRIRSIMLTDHEITWDEHYRWFKRNERNEPPRNLVFEYKGNPIGYIGYTEYDEVNRVCSPGCYLGEIHKVPIDAGMVLFITTMDYAFKYLHMDILKTEVFKKNKRVVKIDKLLGYQVIGEHVVIKSGITEQTYIMQLLRNEWTIDKFIF